MKQENQGFSGSETKGRFLKSTEQIHQELLLKEIRTAFWEMHHSLPSMLDLERLEEGLV